MQRNTMQKGEQVQQSWTYQMLADHCGMQVTKLHTAAQNDVEGHLAHSGSGGGNGGGGDDYDSDAMEIDDDDRSSSTAHAAPAVSLMGISVHTRAPMDNGGQSQAQQERARRTIMQDYQRASTLQLPHENRIGNVLEFDAESHTYSVESHPYASVHKVISHFCEPFDAIAVSERCAATKKEESEYFGMSAQEIRDLWEARAEQSKEIGNRVHEEIETLLVNHHDVDEESLKDESAPKDISGEYPFKVGTQIQQWYDWRQKNLHLDQTADARHLIEKKVFDPDYRIAGTIDAILHNKKTGKYDVWDWKTGKEFSPDDVGYSRMLHVLRDTRDTKYNQYALQLGIYAYILEEHYPSIRVGTLNLLHLPGMSGEGAQHMRVPWNDARRTQIRRVLEFFRQSNDK